jgi:hypothetical protein
MWDDWRPEQGEAGDREPDRTATGWLGGIPVLFVYLFSVWAALIGAMALIVERRR